MINHPNDRTKKHYLMGIDVLGKAAHRTPTLAWVTCYHVTIIIGIIKYSPEYKVIPKKYKYSRHSKPLILLVPDTEEVLHPGILWRLG
jgi:hypothetical protein